MKYKFKPVPSEFEIIDKVKQASYLVNGNLIKWDGDFSSVYSTISSTNDYKPTLLGHIPDLGKD